MLNTDAENRKKEKGDFESEKKSDIARRAYGARHPLSHTVRASADTADAQRYVISAVGQVYADADIMTISAGVDTYAVSLEDGQEQNARAAKKIEEVFSQYGKVREDYFSAYPPTIKAVSISRASSAARPTSSTSWTKFSPRSRRQAQPRSVR